MHGSQRKQKTIALGNYALKTTIGKGNSAVVKLANHIYAKQKVAIKMFDRSGLDNDKAIRLKREIDSMKHLKHPNIIQLYEIMETPKLICLVTEYASNGELYDYIINNKRLSEREARFFFKQIVSAIHYCHKQNIVHRDIKVENLLLNAFLRVKLADFGFSSTYENNVLLEDWCGSPPYSAPELYLSQLYNGTAADIWSLGVVLYILVCRRLPFDARSFHKLRSQVVTGSYNTPFFLSDDCKQLIKGMLTVQSNERFSMEDILNNKWFCADYDVNDQELKSIVNQIENISITETNSFQADENVLNELKKFGIDTDLVLESIKNRVFDENEAMYYLIESKMKKSGQKSYANSENGSFFDITLKNTTTENKKANSQKKNIEGSEIEPRNVQENEWETSYDPLVSKNDLFQNDDTDEYENEIAKQYLSKYGGLRRHTIGTNPDNNHKNDFKSLECLEENSKRTIFNSANEQILSQIKEINCSNIFNQSCSNYADKMSEDFEIDEHILSKIDRNRFNKKLENQENNKKVHESHEECIRNNLIETFNEKSDAEFHTCFANQYLIPPLSYGRRASDGGSNISLFNQYYSTKNSIYDSTSSQYSRGSITSGIPIEAISSDDEDLNQIKSKKARTRQENDLNHDLKHCRTIGEKSFDNSYRNRIFMQHRGSDSNHIDILISNRTHLEHLYNQNINMELSNLHRENLSKDFEICKPWPARRPNQAQTENLHKNSDSKDDLKDEDNLLSVKQASNLNDTEVVMKQKDDELNLKETYNHLEDKSIFQKLIPQSQNDLKIHLQELLVPNGQSLLNLSLLNNKVNLSTNNMSSPSLQMIQEEQLDALTASAASTPRLSQTSTISNNSIMDTSNDDTLEEKIIFNKSSNNASLCFSKSKPCSIDLTSSFFPFVTKQLQTSLYKITGYTGDETNKDEDRNMETTSYRSSLNGTAKADKVEQLVNCFNYDGHNSCLHSINNNHKINGITKLDSDTQSQYVNLVNNNNYCNNYQQTIISSPPTTGP